ncbi:MAG TPA: hypothetical protein VFK02_13030 [Kofleriaceae bacterium]|nr:hypothetical protein [Kofleriaceae bacterium]
MAALERFDRHRVAPARRLRERQLAGVAAIEVADHVAVGGVRRERGHQLALVERAARGVRECACELAARRRTHGDQPLGDVLADRGLAGPGGGEHLSELGGGGHPCIVLRRPQTGERSGSLHVRGGARCRTFLVKWPVPGPVEYRSPHESIRAGWRAPDGRVWERDG